MQIVGVTGLGSLWALKHFLSSIKIVGVQAWAVCGRQSGRAFRGLWAFKWAYIFA